MFLNNLHQLSIGEKYPNQVNCVIEIPKGKNTKYEYDEHLHVFKLTRCLISSLNYPINYGFIPQTIAQDGDPLDVLVYNHDPLDIGTIAECRVIGVLDFVDNGEIDNKIFKLTRKIVMDLARSVNIPLIVKDLDPYDAIIADEIFLTSTSLCVCPAISFNGTTIGTGNIPGPITKRLQEAFNSVINMDFVQQYLCCYSDSTASPF